MMNILKAQRAYYQSGATRDPSARIEALKKLQIALRRYEPLLLSALFSDLGKSPEESFMTELGFLYGELSHAISHVRRWSASRLTLPSFLKLQGIGRVLRDPYGVVLVLSPWNYPLQLSLAPVISAVAAGNCAVLRPSSQAPKTAEALAKIVKESFLPEHVRVVTGDAGTAETLIAMPFDKIFFTGSPSVGRRVMRAASESLVPVTLELGGKCPAIVAADADIRLAARRIVFGKFLGAGQTCVAPDYVLVARPAEATFLKALENEIQRQFGDNPIDSPDIANIVSDRHFDRLAALLTHGRVVVGGQSDRARRRIAPTVLAAVPEESPLMQEEIFGPILPVLTFSMMEEAVTHVRAKPAPLALYLFTQDSAAARLCMRDLNFGGGCINDTAVHLASPRLPFGGVGESGMGAYHGKAGFDCFSREKSVFFATSRLDIPIRYAPRKGRLSFFRRLLR